MEEWAHVKSEEGKKTIIIDKLHYCTYNINKR